MSAAPIVSTLPDRPGFRKIVEGFVAQLSDNLAAMQTAFEQSDLDEVAQLAHWLKGAGGTIGFDCFFEPASRAERLARENCPQELRESIDELVALADRVAVVP